MGVFRAAMPWLAAAVLASVTGLASSSSLRRSLLVRRMGEHRAAPPGADHDPIRIASEFAKMGVQEAKDIMSGNPPERLNTTAIAHDAAPKSPPHEHEISPDDEMEKI